MDGKMCVCSDGLHLKVGMIQLACIKFLQLGLWSISIFCLFFGLIIVYSKCTLIIIIKKISRVLDLIFGIKALHNSTRLYRTTTQQQQQEQKSM